MSGLGVPKEAVGLQLGRFFPGDDLRLCEALRFDGGWAAVDTVLRRAAVSGRVEVGGKIGDYLADVLDVNGSIIETVALDSRSFRALKTRWMRCKYEPRP